jgi:hypothetical protein
VAPLLSAKMSAERGGRGTAKEISGRDVDFGGVVSFFVRRPQNWEEFVRSAEVSSCDGAGD